MNRLRLLHLLCLLALAALVTGLGAPAAAAGSGAGTGVARAGPTVEVFGLSGVLDRSSLDDLRGALTGAERRGAQALLVQLDGFGGLGVDPARVARV
ncbi:MAG TPA: hypothetical protein VFA45_20575, partial [Actinomycetes bacterium]|nr:hypothetical protein [Actinomycetes bacterium]